jgi:hypothetical protein
MFWILDGTSVTRSKSGRLAVRGTEDNQDKGESPRSDGASYGFSNQEFVRRWNNLAGTIANDTRRE